MVYLGDIDDQKLFAARKQHLQLKYAGISASYEVRCHAHIYRIYRIFAEGKFELIGRQPCGVGQYLYRNCL